MNKSIQNKAIQNEQFYENYKHLYEKLRKKAKQIYYQSILTDCQNDMTYTWQIMKKSWEKVKLTLTDFLNQ